MNELKSVKTKSRKRVGRGIGSKKGGHTVGRGQKGQKSRSGYSSPRPGFEGGGMPLSRRIPKLPGFSRGEFDNPKSKVEIKLEKLNQFKDGTEIDMEVLKQAGLYGKKSRNIEIKILMGGKLDKKITLKGIKVSKVVREAIEKKGGKVL